ncbi:MAG TPA: M23 family metallopeptidase [Gemmatimonadaceae bacterium]|nr:M23 family metallopeptidase [Gemmatimonadaceae bacterium]
MLTTTASVAGLVVLIGFGVLLSGFAGIGGSDRATRQLSEELENVRAKLTVLQDTIAMIGRRDEQLRLLAGLPAVGVEVREAGIGGPGLPTVEADPLFRTDPMLAGLAFGARSDLDGLIRRANILSASFAEVADTLSAHADRLASTPSIMPTAGWLSSAFTRSRRHPILHTTRPHEGIDVSAPMGTPIVAPAAGRVTRVSRERGYGLILEIDHGNGIKTRYAHCSKIVVRAGQRVTRGQVVANVGNSGLSTGAHLHYEIHVNGRPVDPLTYVLPAEVIPD